MIRKHKILYVCGLCDYMIGPLFFVFIEFFPSLMSSGKAVDVFNNGLSYKSLIQLFNDHFLINFRARLEGGHEEPLYCPATENAVARICFRSDYPSSALHEVAHWCIAGEKRRQLLDYGYWYEPDGRSSEQQLAFEKVEVKPQAIEWIFSVAAGIKFRISADNLENHCCDSSRFAQTVAGQACQYIETALPERAEIFYQALLKLGSELGCGRKAVATDFTLDQIGVSAG